MKDQWLLTSTPDSSTNEICLHDVTEILLKVVLSIHKHTFS